MLVAISFMDIVNYQASEFFERNTAIFTLHTIDKKSLETIAAEFKLTFEEIQQIITKHTQYEAAVVGTTK